MTRHLVRVLIVVILAGGVAAAAYRLTRTRPVEVVVRPVDRGRVESTVANTRAGTVKACRRARLAPQAGGRVSTLPVRRGDRVRAGDLLLQLWNQDLEAQLQLAESEARAGKARAEQACQQAELASREFIRLDKLFRDGIVDDRTRDRAHSEEASTSSACVAAKASAEEAQAQVEVIRAELAKMILRAPFDGVVAELNAELGEIVTPSPPGIPTPPAVDLIEEGCMYVVAPIDEVDAPRVRKGQPARVSLDAFPGETFEGTVRRLAPYVLDREKQARTVDIEVDISDPSSIPGLVPGYSADIEVLLDTRDDAIRVPTEAVIDEREVLLLVGDRLERKAFEPGISNWECTEVVSGLREGDLVVLSLDREGVVSGAPAVAVNGTGG